MSFKPRTMDKYTKVLKDREADKAAENEVRISGAGGIYKYISYAARLLVEKNLDVVFLKATGQAASVAVNVAEILKSQIAGLNQENTIKSVTVSDEYLPKEEGLDKVVIKRELAVLEIKLSKKAELLNSKSAGFQLAVKVTPELEEAEKKLRANLKDGNRISDAGPLVSRGGYRGGARGSRGGRGGRGRGRGGYGYGGYRRD